MKQVSGFIDSTHLDFVYKLEKSLYGLIQAPWAWFEKLGTNLIELGFVKSKA